MLAGEPHPIGVDVKIQPVGERGGTKQTLQALPVRSLVRDGKTPTTGVFEDPNVLKSVQALKKLYAMDKMIHLKVDIVPKLSDGTELPPESIIIPYDNYEN